MQITELLDTITSEALKNDIIMQYKSLVCFIIRQELKNNDITTKVCDFKDISLDYTQQALDKIGMKIIFKPNKCSPKVKMNSTKLQFSENTCEYDVEILRKVK